jgi:hypothetical protein
MSDLFAHYNINDEQKNILISKNITDIDLLNCLKVFDPNETNCELNKTCLMYYMDERGDFQEDNLTKPGLIANAVYESLSDQDKIEIFMYLEFIEENEIN